MNASGQALQQAITQARDGEPLRAWVMGHCVAEGCPVEEVNVFANEADHPKPFQAPLICPRCRGPLSFDGVELEKEEP